MSTLVLVMDLVFKVLSLFKAAAEAAPTVRVRRRSVPSGRGGFRPCYFALRVRGWFRVRVLLG